MVDVTIVIPTYKRPDRIMRAVQSAFHQTVSSKEIIVVDDNGKDTKEAKETMKELESFVRNHAIIYIQNDTNSGGSFSRNQGLEIAQGKYITFLDDDDEIDPDKLEKQVQKLDELGEEYSACYTGYHKLLEDGSSYQSDETVSGFVYPYALSRSIYNGSGSNLLVRTSVAKEIGGYDISFKRNQDLEFMARLLKNYKLAFVEDDLLTIHYEIREVKRSYEDLVEIDKHFLETFKTEIDSLPENQRKAVYQIIALERWRYSLGRHAQKDAMKNMKENGVTASVFMKYIGYLIDRVIRKKSYGFKLF